MLDCYQQLQAEGFLTSRTGSATRSLAAPTSSRPPRWGPRRRRGWRSTSVGVPDLSSFPVREWLWALREAARTAPTEAFGRGDPRGSAALRERCWPPTCGGVRGAVADPERLVVCAGFAQGLNLVLRALARRGVRRVAVEDPASWTMPP